MKNLILPGNPRYQPKQMQDIFGYDNLYRMPIAVELATMKVLHDLGIIPDEEYAALNQQIEEEIKSVTTSEVDEIESNVTHHDVRALVMIIQSLINEKLKRWVHVPLTSYDPLDTGRSLQFLMAYRQVIKPSIYETAGYLMEMTERYANTLQIGRTHGQHALPVTVGFWLANILDRLLNNWIEMDRYAHALVGKISGAVGAYNAQIALGLTGTKLGKKSLESLVLKELGLKPARISTQILPPEPLAYFLFSCTMTSATLGQFGRDCRHLMRSEIAEVAESFEAHQVGSSTMAHKRNPITFENLEGTWLKTKCEFNKVFEILISEHQRDLVGSSILRDLPIIVINLQQQLNTLNKKNKAGVPFLKRISIDETNCRRNFQQNAGYILAEPIYLALQMHGYEKDAHKLVNEVLMKIAKEKKINLFEALQLQAREDAEIAGILSAFSPDMQAAFQTPEKYTGLATEKAIDVVGRTQDVMKLMEIS
ncbi:MAG: lyase family protein [Patescibacteria group bacterium]